jgi:hypothetical protein
MLIVDSLTLDASGLKLTQDGYLVGDARVSRAGNVQQYYGHELGLDGEEKHKVFGVYRDPDVVFDNASMLSLAGRPVTRGHPDEGVTADNWKDLAVGQMGGTVRRDGEHVVASMAIMDSTAAKEIAAGARSLSAGYSVAIVRDSGTAPDGTPYEFKQEGPLRFNHVAYLPDNNPRAGNTRIGDNNPAPKTPNGGHDMADALRKLLVDGLTIEVTEQGAQAIEKLTKQLSDAADKTTSLADAYAAALALKDADLAKKDAEIDGLKAKVLTDAALDARVKQRADLITNARLISDADYTGKSDAEIRKAAVLAKLGDAALAGKSDAYVDARFDILLEDANKDPMRQHFIAQDGKTTINDNGQDAWEKSKSEAWKTAGKGA